MSEKSNRHTVMELLCAGKSNKEIIAETGISQEYVSNLRVEFKKEQGDDSISHLEKATHVRETLLGLGYTRENRIGKRFYDPCHFRDKGDKKSWVGFCGQVHKQYFETVYGNSSYDGGWVHTTRKLLVKAAEEGWSIDGVDLDAYASPFEPLAAGVLELFDYKKGGILFTTWELPGTYCTRFRYKMMKAMLFNGKGTLDRDDANLYIENHALRCGMESHFLSVRTYGSVYRMAHKLEYKNLGAKALTLAPGFARIEQNHKEVA